MMSVAYVRTAQSPATEYLPTGAPPVCREVESRLTECRSAIYGFLRRKGFSAEEADDLTQETLLRAYVHLNGFRGSSFHSWLYRIAANIAVDHLRRQRLATVPLEQVTLPEPYSDDLSAGLDREERAYQMLSVISELPECHRRILQLRYYEDRSLDEIAATMQCTQMAAKLRVFRAVTALRKRWHAKQPGVRIA